jgi:hypothetical protein
MEGEQHPRIGNMVTITDGFTRCEVQFIPPTLPSSSSKGKSSYSNTNLFLRFVTTPLLWATWKICMEPLKGLVDIQRWLAPSSWMIYSKSLTVGVTCNRYVIPIYSHLSWYGKVCSNILRGCLWMIKNLNLGLPMRFILKSCGYIGHPIMFPSQMDLWF